MGVANLDVDQGGSGLQVIGKGLFGGGAISPTIWGRDMGPHITYAWGVGRIPP